MQDLNTSSLTPASVPSFLITKHNLQEHISFGSQRILPKDKANEWSQNAEEESLPCPLGALRGPEAVFLWYLSSRNLTPLGLVTLITLAFSDLTSDHSFPHELPWLIPGSAVLYPGHIPDGLVS